jgi:galactokinase
MAISQVIREKGRLGPENYWEDAFCIPAPYLNLFFWLNFLLLTAQNASAVTTNKLQAAVLAAFQSQFQAAPQVVVRSPGRINLIGEHTDYNEGFVLPAAVNKAVWIALSPSESKTSTWFSLDFQEKIELNIHPAQTQSLRWPNYLLGIVQQFQLLGIEVPAFNCVIAGDVPLGAGMSSSAALEAAVAFAINEWLGMGLSRIELALLCQRSEHQFIGVKCGIMDMFASLHGKRGQAIRLDCRDLSYDYFPIDLQGYSLVLFDTQVKHSLADSEYNQRRAACEEGVAILGEKYQANFKSLRDITQQQVIESAAILPTHIFQACHYVTGEIQRTLNACEDLKAGNLAAFGQKMFLTHQGLSEQYRVSCPELDFLVDAVKNHPQVPGSRMMGGGFGGCTINIVAENAVQDLYEGLKGPYAEKFGVELGMYVAVTDEGSERV